MIENKMGTEKIGKLLLGMSIPLVISMLVQAMYNLVDSIFVSRLNENALIAVSLAFPVQMVMLAIAIGTAIGVNATAAKYLGAGNKKSASDTAKNGIFLSFISFIVVAIIIYFFTAKYYTGQLTQIGEDGLPFITDNNKQILSYAVEYTNIIGIFSLFVFEQIMFERLLQSTGKTFYSMVTQIVGALVNLVLDPLFIFGYLGFPKLGVTGAALATIIGQLCGMLSGLILNIKVNKEYNLNFKGFMPNKQIIGEIYSIGFPSIIMQSIGSVMYYIFSKMLIDFTSTAVAVFGSYFKLNGFVFMPIFAINSSMMPIIAYNYGAKNPKRIKDTLKIGVITAILVMLVGTLIFLIIPKYLLLMFKPSNEMLEIGEKAFRIISLSFVPAGFSIALSALFQAMGRAVYSMINSIIRMIAVILPTAYFLSKYFGLNAIWWSFPIAELCGVIIVIIFYNNIKKDILNNLGV